MHFSSFKSKEDTFIFLISYKNSYIAILPQSFSADLTNLVKVVTSSGICFLIFLSLCAF